MARSTSDTPARRAEASEAGKVRRRKAGKAAVGTEKPENPAGRARTARSGSRPADPEKANSAPLPPIFAKGDAASCRIRMYRQGLGDCFLLTLPRAAESQNTGDFHILFDCGVILGTKNKAERLRQVVQDVIRDTGGFVDVLVVTHEHYDHVSGFVLADDLFAAAPPEGQAPPPDMLSVGEVWFGWTEDPADPLARKLRADRDAKKQKLAAMLMAMTEQGMAETPTVQGLAGILGFFGVDFSLGGSQLGMSRALAARPSPGDTAPRGDTGSAMDFARSLASPDRVHYRRPGEPVWTTPELGGVRIYVLGPPLAPEMLRRTYVRSEVYHLAEDTSRLDSLYLAARGTAAEESEVEEAPAWGDACPFEANLGMSLPDARAASAAPSAGAPRFLQDRYAGISDDPLDLDQSWRRIDGDWAGGAVEFALQLDAATNNTSLALAIEFGPVSGAGPVLLFPGDAQVGSWLSWQDVAWPAQDGSPRITGPDLLTRTAFYKVAHHGSENATARAKGLELMPDAAAGGSLIAYMPVDRAMALAKGWKDMPLASLVEALIARTGNRLVRLDKPLPEVLRGARAAKRDFDPPASNPDISGDPLYYEMMIDLSAGANIAAPPTASETRPASPLRRGRGRAAGLGLSAVTTLDQATPERVRWLFPDTPLAPIQTNLPFVLAGLRARSLMDRDMLLMALATIRAETEGFVPIDEGRSKFNTRVTPFDLYEPATEAGQRLGSTQRGDGARFKGRGFVQLTGRDNYTRIGPQIGVDLLGDPSRANNPSIAGLILAQFLKNREAKVRNALASGDLKTARELVNDGSHGLERFTDAFRRGREEFHVVD